MGGGWDRGWGTCMGYRFAPQHGLHYDEMTDRLIYYLPFDHIGMIS